MSPTLYQRLDFAVWRRIHRLPRFFVKLWQARELKRIVLNAYKNIPLYRELLDERHTDPKSVDLQNLKKLPLTSKKLFRQYPTEKWSRIATADTECYHWRQTSGSTGEPFRFPFNGEINLLARFGSHQPAPYYSHRCLIWEGAPLYFFDKMRIAKIATADPKDNSLYIHDSYLRERAMEVLSLINEFRPNFLYGIVTSVVELARLVDSAKAIIKIPFVYAYGEKMTEVQRIFLEKTFGCWAYNGYGTEETGEIAIECRFHDGLHIYEESCIFEVLNEKNEEVREGEIGRIVVTNFFNDAIPVIRYETSDHGKIIREKCGCGLRTPRLLIEGREGVVITINGKRIMPVEISSVMAGLDNDVLRYQVVKTREDELEIRVIPSPTFDSAIEEKISGRYLEKFGIRAAVKIVNELNCALSGKNQFFLDETLK